jgi:hypothetical protein
MTDRRRSEAEGGAAERCSCKNHPQKPHPLGEPPCAWAPLIAAVGPGLHAVDGWCREHDEREPCQVCGVRRIVNSARDRIPTVGYDHSLCGADPCSDCR